MSKYTELMLDVACGDASEYDAYIEQAIGKINVSNAIFALESKIAELPEGEEFMCVQEAADAGLPFVQEEAVEVSCEAVKQQLTAFYDLINNTAKKVQSACDKDMKLLIAFGKKNGVALGGNFEEFVNNLASKVTGAKFSDKKFIKGKYAVKLAESFGKGMINLMAAYGLSIEVSDPIIDGIIGKANKAAEVSTVRCIEGKLTDGGKALATEKITSRGFHYTDSPKSKDFVQMAIALYTVLNVAKDVASTTSKSKKAAIANMNKCMDNDTLKAKRITRSCEGINDDIKKWTSNLTSVVDSITTAFGDSVYAINEVGTK